MSTKVNERSGSPVGYPAEPEATRMNPSKRAEGSAKAMRSAKIERAALESKAKRLKILKNRQETLQQEIDQLEADLKAQLEAWNVDEVQAGPFRVVWKLVNSSRFDSKRFKAENGNLYNLYMIPNSYRKFLVV